MSFCPVWINLETLYNREGYPQYAEAAQLWMKKAEQAAKMDADKKRYHNKLDLLIIVLPISNHGVCLIFARR